MAQAPSQQVPFSKAINNDKPPPLWQPANSNLRGNLKGGKTRMGGGTEAFPDLGRHCQHSECKQLDFLPFNCNGCRKVIKGSSNLCVQLCLAWNITALIVCSCRCFVQSIDPSSLMSVRNQTTRIEKQLFVKHVQRLLRLLDATRMLREWCC